MVLARIAGPAQATVVRGKSRADGQRATRILDPRIGPPLTHRLASVTVIDTLAVRTDTFDTALMVLGTDEGMGLARTTGPRCPVHRGPAAGFTERVTPRFQAIAAKGY